MFIPILVGQLEYLRKLFAQIAKTAEDPKTANEIGPAFVDLARSVPPDPKSALTAYLAEIARQAREEFIGPIDKVLGAVSTLSSMKVLRKWSVEVDRIASSVVATRKTLFVYELRAFLRVTNKVTGEELVGPPKSLAIAIFPFDVTVAEAVSVASAIHRSVMFWNRNQFRLVNRLATLRTAEATRRAADKQLWIQLSLIVVTIALSTFFLFAGDFLSHHRGSQEEAVQQLPCLGNDGGAGR